MTKVTTKQEIVLGFIQGGCQSSSYTSTVDRLNALERKRFIRRTPNRHRGIRLVRRTPEPQLEAPSLREVV